MSVEVGVRLRALREQRFSLRALAGSAGMSANALSLSEWGRTSPSVTTLSRLAEALRVPVTAFFRGEIRQVPIVHCKTAERSGMPLPGGLWEGLGGEQFVGRVLPFVMTLEARATSGPHLMVHSGQEFVFCLQGGLEYSVELETFALEAGDSLLLGAHMRHRWRNSVSVPCSAMLLLLGGAEDSSPAHHPPPESRPENLEGPALEARLGDGPQPPPRTREAGFERTSPRPGFSIGIPPRLNSNRQPLGQRNSSDAGGPCG
jgi:quercetin dioxygenase-like cupin family protein/DNA-binding XRE family transcriptional regulator